MFPYSGFSEKDQNYWVCVEVNEGSYGARATKDGLDTIDNLMANTKNVPCEEIELRYPLRVERYEIRPEQPGAGTWRGGCGHVREVRFLEDGYFSCNGDRILEKPFGIFGGQNGHGARLTLNPGTKIKSNGLLKYQAKRLNQATLFEFVDLQAPAMEILF